MKCFWPECEDYACYKVLGTAIVCCIKHLETIMGSPWAAALNSPLVYYIDHDTDDVEPLPMTRKMRQQLMIGQLTADMGIFNV